MANIITVHLKRVSQQSERGRLSEPSRPLSADKQASSRCSHERLHEREKEERREREGKTALLETLDLSI